VSELHWNGTTSLLFLFTWINQMLFEFTMILAPTFFFANCRIISFLLLNLSCPPQHNSNINYMPFNHISGWIRFIKLFYFCAFIIYVFCVFVWKLTKKLITCGITFFIWWFFVIFVSWFCLIINVSCFSFFGTLVYTCFNWLECVLCSS